MCVCTPSGPYRFTETDAKRTVQFADEVFDLYAEGRDPAVIEHLRPPAPTGDQGVDLAAVWSSWTAAGPALRAAGQLPGRAEGTVVQLSVSPGGLPKLPIDSAEVTWKGMAGDRQATRLHHGRPWQALCIWSAEVIDDFHAAGHNRSPRAGPARTSPSAGCRGPTSAPACGCDRRGAVRGQLPTHCRAPATSRGSSTATSA